MTPTKPTRTEQETLVVIPSHQLDMIIAAQSEILSIIKGSENLNARPVNPDYFSEKEAISIINKSKTWLWQQRKMGKIKSYKIGRTNYFLKTAISDLIKKGGENE